MGKAGKTAAVAKDGAPAKAPNSGKEKKAPEQAAASNAKTKGKAAKGAKQQKEDAGQGAFLSAVRPAPRPIFFFLFVACCAAVVALYDPCDVKGKKRDCGYSGVTPNNCRSVACFLKGGGAMKKKTVKVTRAGSDKLGLTLSEEGSGLVVKEILVGSIMQHNAKQTEDSEDYIAVGDTILKVSGSSSKASIKKAMDDTGDKKVELEIQRSRLPSFLQWVQNPNGKPNMVEKMLTSPGSIHFGKTWLFNAQMAFACWLISGYPLTSLPMYFTLSAAVAFQLTRCCHDESVGGGVPHCYLGHREPMQEVFQKVWAKSKDFANKVKEDPRTYLEGLFVPEKK